MVDTNRRIKCPTINFGEFILLIGIFMFITENPGTNWTEYLSENIIDLFSG